MIRRNSTSQFTEEDIIINLIEDLVKCGYHRERLNNLVDKLKSDDCTRDTTSTLTSALVLVVPYFQEILPRDC